MPLKNMKSQRSVCHFLLKLMLVCLFCPITAQARTLTGVITSATDEEPLIGATVVVMGTNTATVTNIDGVYSISVEDGQTLRVSYIGFLAAEVKIKGQSKLDIKLREDPQSLDDVVVVGYGTMKRSDITGAVASVSEEDIKRSIITSADQALQGRVAGVQVTQNSGSPGGGISVAIRGVNSLNGNEPLYIIDGVAIDGQTNGNSSALSSINPSDIVSMEVLKDASATAIYGSRASNGVVIITTRHGSIGKPKITFEAYYALQQLPKRLQTMNLREYAYLYNERVDVLGWGEREEFADPSILGDGTDWQKEIFRTAPMQNYQVSVSGGNEATQYMLSGGYLKQEGIALGSDFQRFSARINVDTKITKWLQVGMQSSFSHTKKNNTIDNGNVIETALRQLPEMPARNPDGSWGAQEENQLATYYSNPLADALTKENYEKGLQALLNAYAEIKFYKDLSLRVEYGGSYNYNNGYQFTPELDLGTWKSTSSGNRSASNSSYWSFKQYLTWRHDFNKNSFDVMLGHEAQESAWENLWGSRTGYLFNSVHELNVADLKTAKNGNSKNSSSIESYYGRINYSYDDRYLLTATLRADGSSTFGPANRWGWFPSAAVAWRFQNESFLRDVEWLTNGKLRLGWGLVGNQNAGSYAYGATMNSVATAWGTGFYPNNYANDKLKWEQTRSWNLGLDLAFLNNRIEFILDLYHKTTDNLLMQAALPTYVSGVITSPWVNTGSLRNKGIDITLNAIPVTNKDFSWRTGITMSLNRNKVLKLYTESTSIPGTIGGLAYTLTTEGEPVAQFYGYNVIGMFKEENDFYRKDANGDFLLDAEGNKQFVAIPENKTVDQGTGIWYGDYIYQDINEDGVIDEKDRVYLGNPEPLFTFGFNNTISWKDFDLNIFFTGSVGNKVFNYLGQQQSNPTDRWVMLKSVRDFAKITKIDPDGEATLENMHVANPNCTTYRIDTSASNNNNRMSNKFVEDGSYLRLRNLALGYTLPRKLTKQWGINNVRFYVNIQNLFTVTNYKGYDPEVGSYNQGVLLRGIDYARYPSQRIYTFGLNVNL